MADTDLQYLLRIITTLDDKGLRQVKNALNEVQIQHQNTQGAADDNRAAHSGLHVEMQRGTVVGRGLMFTLRGIQDVMRGNTAAIGHMTHGLVMMSRVMSGLSTLGFVVAIFSALGGAWKMLGGESEKGAGKHQSAAEKVKKSEDEIKSSIDAATKSIQEQSRLAAEASKKYEESIRSANAALREQLKLNNEIAMSALQKALLNKEISPEDAARKKAELEGKGRVEQEEAAALVVGDMAAQKRKELTDKEALQKTYASDSKSAKLELEYAKEALVNAKAEEADVAGRKLASLDLGSGVAMPSPQEEREAETKRRLAEQKLAEKQKKLVQAVAEETEASKLWSVEKPKLEKEVYKLNADAANADRRVALVKEQESTKQGELDQKQKDEAKKTSLENQIALIESGAQERGMMTPADEMQLKSLKLQQLMLGKDIRPESGDLVGGGYGFMRGAGTSPEAFADFMAKAQLLTGGAAHEVSATDNPAINQAGQTVATAVNGLAEAIATLIQDAQSRLKQLRL